MMVLEDNLRCPSGAPICWKTGAVQADFSRHPGARYGVRPVSDYPARLFTMLQSLAERPNPTVAVLTGIYITRLYFEHSTWLSRWVLSWWTGHDLVVDDGYVKMRT